MRGLLKHCFAVIQVLVLLATLLAPPAHAGTIPRPDLPKRSYGGTFSPDLRLGQWLPCSPDFEEVDCIQYVGVRRLGESEYKELQFQRNTDFKLDDIEQIWNQDSKGDEIYSNWRVKSTKNSIDPGKYLLPEGYALADGSRLIPVGAAYFGPLQLKVGEPNRGELPTDFEFKVILKSQTLARTSGWVQANTKDPRVTFPASDLVAVEAVAAASPWLQSADCYAAFVQGNDLRGRLFTNIVVNILVEPNGAKKRSSVVVGTNGWYCFGGITWDSTLQQLLIRVGTSHYDQDGKVIDGWFEAKIAGSIAREWWRIDPRTAVGYAKVEVSYPNGDVRVATTTAKYVPEQDWIDLRAYGFTYSAPTIAVSMKKPEQDQTVQTPASPPQPVPVTPRAGQACTKQQSFTSFKVSGSYLQCLAQGKKFVWTKVKRLKAKK